MNAAERIDFLEEENIQLRAMLKQPSFEPPESWDLSPCEVDLLSCLYSSPNRRRSKAALLVASVRKRDADEKVVEVRVSAVRRKLKPYGVEIKTLFGFGYELPSASKLIISSALERRA